MKTIEEKAKAYDEALERFKAFKEKYYTKDTVVGDAIFDKTGRMQKDFESIFPPEESEDERIRKWLLEYFYLHRDDLRGASVSDMDILNWLEKQKEQKPRWEINNPHTTKWTKEMIDEKFEELVEPKPGEWSKKDEMYLSQAIETLERENYLILANKLKSLRPQPKQEWSEEDKETIEILKKILKVNHPNGKFKTTEAGTTDVKYISTDEIISRLKSLRPSWKPSEEQMAVLLNAEGLMRANNYKENAKILAELYQELKKL